MAPKVRVSVISLSVSREDPDNYFIKYLVGVRKKSPW